MSVEHTPVPDFPEISGSIHPEYILKDQPLSPKERKYGIQVAEAMIRHFNIEPSQISVMNTRLDPYVPHQASLSIPVLDSQKAVGLI
jgi:hypothetical protein